MMHRPGVKKALTSVSSVNEERKREIKMCDSYISVKNRERERDDTARERNQT